MAHTRLPISRHARLAPGEHDLVTFARAPQIVAKLRPMRRCTLRAGCATPEQRSGKDKYKERLIPFHGNPFSISGLKIKSQTHGGSAGRSQRSSRKNIGKVDDVQAVRQVSDVTLKNNGSRLTFPELRPGRKVQSERGAHTSGLQVHTIHHRLSKFLQ